MTILFAQTGFGHAQIWHSPRNLKHRPYQNIDLTKTSNVPANNIPWGTSNIYHTETLPVPRHRLLRIIPASLFSVTCWFHIGDILRKQNKILWGCCWEGRGGGREYNINIATFLTSYDNFAWNQQALGCWFYLFHIKTLHANRNVIMLIYSREHFLARRI